MSVVEIVIHAVVRDGIIVVKDETLVVVGHHDVTNFGNRGRVAKGAFEARINGPTIVF